MKPQTLLVGLVAVLSFGGVEELLACGDKFLVTGRGTRYQRPKNARAASILIYADPAFPSTLGKVPVEAVLKREGHRFTTVETIDQLAAILSGGRFDVVLATSRSASAVQRLLAGAPDAPVVVSFCPRREERTPGEADAPCLVKTPPKAGSLLEAIDKAVVQHDKNLQKVSSRG